MDFYGVVGEKLTHSLSPQIHARIFEELNIKGAYKLFEIPKEISTDNIKNDFKQTFFTRAFESGK